MPWGGRRRRWRRRVLLPLPLTILLVASWSGPQPAAAFLGFGQRPGASGAGGAAGGGGSSMPPCLLVASTVQHQHGQQQQQVAARPGASAAGLSTTALQAHECHHQEEDGETHASSSPSSSPPPRSHHHPPPPPPPPPSPTSGRAPSTTERHLNRALHAIPPDADAEAVLAYVAKEVAYFNAVNCATALNRLSRAAFKARWPPRKVAGDRRFAALLAQTGRRLGESGPAQQNQYMSAFARLGVLPPPALLSALLAAVEANVPSYKAVELAGLLNALAKLSATNPIPCPPTSSAPPTPAHWPRPLLRRLASQATATLSQGEGTGAMACNTYCSLAKLGFPPGPELTGRLALRLLELDVATLDAHWLAQTLNAMARHSSDPGRDFLLAARDEVLLRLNRQELLPLDLAMCTSAFGKLRPHPGPFFHRTLLRYAGKHLEAIGAAGPQTLSLLLGGLGNLQATAAMGTETAASSELVAGLVRLLEERLEEFKPQELANALGGLGKMRARPEAAVLARVGSVVERRLSQPQQEGPSAFTPTDLASATFGLRRMRFAPQPSFLGAVRGWALRLLARVDGRAAARGKGGGGGLEAAAAAAADARDVGHALNVLVRLAATVAPTTGGDGGVGAAVSWPGVNDVLGQAADVLMSRRLLTTAPLQSLAMVLGAFARFEHHPGPAFLTAAARAGLGAEDAEEGMGGGEVEAAAVASSGLHTALLLQALSRLNHEPTPAQLDRALAHLAPNLEELTPKTLFQTLYVVAKWDPSPSTSSSSGRAAFLRAWSTQAPRRGLLVALTTPQLVVAAWALRALGYRVSPDARRAFHDALGNRALVSLTDTEAASLLHSLRGIGLDVESDVPPVLLLRGGGSSSSSSNHPLPTTTDTSGPSSSMGPLPLHELPHEFLSAPAVLALKRPAARQRAMVTAPIFPSGPETTDDGPMPTATATAVYHLESGHGTEEEQQQQRHGRSDGGCGDGQGWRWRPGAQEGGAGD